MSSCSDFFDQESDRVIYADKDHLNNWSDTVYSVTGILNKMQAIADRTILLGEVRGDLVSLTSTANADLRQLASFSVGDDNQYNQPRDYYAIINNCNYFIEHADISLKNNRSDTIFIKEYAAVKAIRAWTYLQLALNYGSVPFVTKPILTKDESEMEYPRMELADICQYFIDDLATLPKSVETQYPDYGHGDAMRNNYSRVFFFPINIIRGDLYLWLGSTKGKTAGRQDFLQAIKCYYAYITQRNGDNSAYPTGLNFCMWNTGSTSWNRFLTCLTRQDGGFVVSVGPTEDRPFSALYSQEYYDADGELITMIAGDSIRAEGNYSELRNLFVSRDENDDMVSIAPSNYIVQLSQQQVNLCVSSNRRDPVYAPSDLTDTKGDLRLYNVWQEEEVVDQALGTRINAQYIYKYRTSNVHIYRRQMLYLRLAEALNLVGQPRMAFKILERGLADDVIEQEVLPYLSSEDSLWVKTNFSFPVSQYKVLNAENLLLGSFSPTTYNTMGIHSRGSGFTPINEYYRLAFEDSLCYRMVNDSTFVFDNDAYEQVKLQQQQQVDSLILNENALECCFEGTRYYDLMRYALRSDNPGRFLTEHVNARGGEGTSEGIDLTNTRNWYLRWGNGKVGY